MTVEQGVRADWHTAAIEDIAEKVAMGPFGSSIKVETFVPDGVPIISGQHLHGFRVDDSPGFNFITEEHAQRLGNANVKRGDIVLTHRGTIGQVAYIPQNSQFHQYVVSQSQFYVRCDHAKVVPEFVALYLRSPEGQHQLLANTSQVGVPSIAQPVTYLRTVRIPLPPLTEQRAIAHVLGTLDDKIELNRRMNQTLEEMARALFKSWFVDFDPVRAKMEGRWRRGESLPGLPAEHYDLFSDRLVPSELGEIPEGWEVRTLGSCLATLETGYRPRGGVSGIVAGIPSIGAESIDRVGFFDFSKTKYVPVEFYDGMNRGVVEDGDVLIYKDGGRPGELEPAVTYVSQGFPFNVSCINEHVYRVRTNQFSQQLLYCYLTTSAAFCQMRELATGVAQPGLNRRAVKSIAIVVPADFRLLSACQERIDRLLDECNINSVESRGLWQIRDTLLPKLVSGEVRVEGR